MRSLYCAFRVRSLSSLIMSLVALSALWLCASVRSYAAECPANGQLPPGGSAETDLLIKIPCTVVGQTGAVGVYVYHNVNVVAGGSLSFEDTRIDFHAESIIVENGGTLQAGSVMHPIGTNPPIQNEMGPRLRIYLWGKSTDKGALCNDSRCGVPSDLWSSNTTLAQHKVPTPKNASCVKASTINQSYRLPGDDCFYEYDVFDAADLATSRAAYFGHKVLALSYGGTIKMFGVKGATYDVKADNDPASTGTSWVRLAALSSDRKTLTLSGPVGTWGPNDHIIVTTTDYLPTHNEEVVIDHLAPNNVVVLKTALQYPHNASVYQLPSDTPASIGPRDTRSVETRAAVGLLTRSIAVLSEGQQPDTDTSEHDHFPPSEGFFGGHTIVRQGFENYQIKGVEFYHLGQGGLIGHYPIHFHMARKTPQPSDPTQAPYVRDSSIHDSMTRWITVHATQGMTLARNVGYLSIGHGFYLEDATEVNNKIYANLGAGVIAAVQSETLNPRSTPGILARPGDPARGDFMPYRSDWNHPSAFWIMNGWNDFQYNMAAGVTSCGACYWLVPGATGGPSMFEVWDGYASQQINNADGSTFRMDNTGRAGLAPLKNFVGNSCSAAQFSFITIGDTYDCGGFSDGTANDTTLKAVVNTLAPKKPDPGQGIPDNPGYHVYYPQITGLRNPSACPNGDTGDCSTSPPCAQTGVNKANCEVTVLDHYTTSFNYAQTNFAAIWMRAKWFLFTDGAVTDSQYGGLNFTTGGGYTHSDNPYGNWMLAYRSVFIGTSQPVSGSSFQPANPFASNAGPFNPKSGLTCSNTADLGYCLSVDDGITIQMGPFPGQRMFSVYDGPAFQRSNAYLDVYPTPMSGSGWMYLDRHEDGVPKDSASQCYLPNAAIAWKQPNGFYYPPAFHSQNLMFRNTNIRHFLIEPLFIDGTLKGDPEKIHARYCPGNDSPAMFNNFTDIDRQTVLNDGVPDRPNFPGGDGSLTGLTGAEQLPKKVIRRETISVNEDPFFNAPLETVECASDKHATIADGKGAPGTAKTSPYEYFTTGMIAKCAIGFYQASCPPPNQNNKCTYPKECNGDIPTNAAYWTHQGATPETFGVPLYREYLTDAEYDQNPRPKPFTKMMGQGQGQRSALTLDHGRFYIDTSNNCTTQGGCLPSYPATSHGVSVFQAGETYYVYFVYGRDSTQVTYDIYLGNKDETGKWSVSPVRGVFDDDNFHFKPATSSAWLGTPQYSKDTGILTVTLDLSKSSIANELSAEFANACAPATYCAVKTVNGVKTCGCAAGTSCKDDEACSWGPKDPDCPEAGCYGFAFTMPGDFEVPASPVAPPPPIKFSEDSYFGGNNVKFNVVDVSQFGQKSQCQYTSPPPPQQ